MIILNELCQLSKLNLPIYSSDYHSLVIGEIRFDCPMECVEFVQSEKPSELSYRKVPYESPDEYIGQNTALVALHGWPKKIHQVFVFSSFLRISMKNSIE